MTDDLQQVLAADPAELDYEQARDALTAIVARLEGGGASLAEAMTLWEKGELLARRCTDYLDDAEKRLTAATGGADAAAGPAPAPQDPPW